MPGFLFYWIAWSVWIIATFLLDKDHPSRGRLAAASLLLIILSPCRAEFFHLEFTLSLPLILFFCYGHYGKRGVWELANQAVRILIVTVAHAGYLLMVLSEPVLLIVHPAIWKTALFFLLGQLAFSRFSDRLYGTLTGFVHGQILYALLLEKYGIRVPLDAFFLDETAVLFAVLQGWNGLARLFAQFGGKSVPAGKERSFS